MASSTSTEILDLRHFSAPMLRAVLEAEGDLWKQRLHWDYRSSARLLMQYLDNHLLPGYAAVAADQVIGYVFCVYEETKAVIGDVFAVPSQPDAHAIEEMLLRHLLELLVNSPQVDRIESQLLVHPSGTHSAVFREAGLELFRRLFMVQQLHELWSPPRISLPGVLELRPWRDEDLAPAARLICEAYRDHPDSLINDQYRSVHGSMRFLNNIVRYSGCGAFSAPVSHVVVHRSNRKRSHHPGVRAPWLPAPRDGSDAALRGGIPLYAPRRAGNFPHRDPGQPAGHRTLHVRGLYLQSPVRCGGLAKNPTLILFI
jgi:hypothetical protein